jgi:hypothetical protein
MTNEFDGTPQTSSNESALTNAESLIWALLDDCLDDGDAVRLCHMLETDAAVRSRYVECVQLHVDLAEHFALEALRAEPEKAASGRVFPPLIIGGLPAESFQPSRD